MSNPLRQYVCITEPIPVIGTNIFFNSCCEPKFCPHLSHENVVSLLVKLSSEFFPLSTSNLFILCTGLQIKLRSNF